MHSGSNVHWWVKNFMEKMNRSIWISVQLDGRKNGQMFLECTGRLLHGRSLIDTLSKNDFVADLPNDFWGFLISVMKVKKQDVSDALLHSDKGFRASLWEN